jgi:hypothetical protein
MLPLKRTSPCYIIGSNGVRTTILEKDLTTALIRSSAKFIAQTNHDIVSRNETPQATQQSQVLGMEDIIEESTERAEFIEGLWKSAVVRYRKEHPQANEDDAFVSTKDLQRWMVKYPIANECTHFACVMDPTKGEVSWAKVWRKPKTHRR